MFNASIIHNTSALCRHYLAIMMAFSLLGSGSASAFAATNEETLNVVTFHEGLTIAEITGKAALSINYFNLNALSSRAKEIVDSGTMIYIANPEVSAEAIADLLSISKTNTTSYQNLLLMAYSIYKLDEKYVFANHYAAFAYEGKFNVDSDDAYGSKLQLTFGCLTNCIVNR